MTEIKTIILDFGKVLAGPTTGNWFITPKFKELVNTNEIDLEKFNNALKLNQNYLDAIMKIEEEEYYFFTKFYNGILNEMRYQKDSLSIARKIAKNFTYQKDKYTFYQGIKEELTTLSKQYQLLMLTDNWPCILRILTEEQLDKYFQKIYVSSIYGCKKEQGTFFDYPIKDFHLVPEETLFIDDNEQLLDVAVKKKLKVRQMDREREVTNSKHPIIHDLKNII